MGDNDLLFGWYLTGEITSIRYNTIHYYHGRITFTLNEVNNELIEMIQ